MGSGPPGINRPIGITQSPGVTKLPDIIALGITPTLSEQLVSLRAKELASMGAS